MTPGLLAADNQRSAIKLRSDATIDPTRFVYYLLATTASFESSECWLAQRAARQPKASSTTSRFALPPLPVQQRIAGILSAYDELIENSQRRIKILESMARALYREWFVHFRFPGHENHPRVASPLGEIPQGWEVKKLGDVLQLIDGCTSTVTELHARRNSDGQSRHGRPTAFMTTPTMITGRTAIAVVQLAKTAFMLPDAISALDAQRICNDSVTRARTAFAVLTRQAFRVRTHFAVDRGRSSMRMPHDSTGDSALPSTRLSRKRMPEPRSVPHRLTAMLREFKASLTPMLDEIRTLPTPNPKPPPHPRPAAAAPALRADRGRRDCRGRFPIRPQPAPGK